MKAHSLHMITTGRQPLEQVRDILARCPAKLADALHVREKQRGARELIAWHDALRPLMPDTPLFVNDRLDAALAAGADGVQLGGSSLTAAEARAIAGSRLAIGRSVHSAAEAAQAAAEGADFAVFGHVYATGSKPGLTPRGVDALRAAVEAAPIPVIAIGGITPERIDEVLSTGCAGVAVLSGILEHEDPAGQLVRYRKALDSFRRPPKAALRILSPASRK
ncbi:thiamine phosphate synthase [Paenibacillus ginsengihumi]|uniref:thiamine phosphate synthase n=1 Tax=Paenibacillus ginsengihumi TaxID=431596 RepID=UPI000366CC3D|nr:thiamine phosphate synthase [Paenibacillus ginsengihumi]